MNPRNPDRKSRSFVPLALVLILAVLAGVITAATLRLRDQTRRQIAARDAEIFYAVALMYADASPEIDLLGLDDLDSQLAIVLQTSNLKSASRGTNHTTGQWRVLGARLFDPNGAFVKAFPDNVLPASLSPERVSLVRRLEPHARFHRSLPFASLFEDVDGARTQARGPILEINVPLHTSQNPRLAGIAQFLIEAQSMGRQFQRLDRNLLLQALAAFLVSGGLLTLAVGWSFRRLQATNRQLADHAEHLRRANLELALAAKTNALGTVTAHLLHGLKNPLTGLQNFMNGLRGPESGGLVDYDRAVASTRRMQAMITQVINILRENQGTTAYEVSAEEIAGLVREQVQSVAHENDVRLEVPAPAAAQWSNRVGQLTLLILTNLVQNAIQASPRGSAVRVTTELSPEGYVWRVADEGPGFPPGQQPFAPCQSAKEGGTGIGLALSKQLANHLQAGLDLTPGVPTGCVFVLVLPFSLPSPKSERAASSQMG